ncbi:MULTISPECIES: zinc-binding dehydrogenase [Sorangium]|uniref:Threonine 3-dehydrogenase n=1 Tax=Sorangium cellulosum TaxID=56 RepID=A0A4P2R0X0_SORCE|nr:MULTISPECIES: zinc-binding dehydrogenase [Sorangium]AUX36557.1 threonine 3-dehydrogenase [Sorangium cellulosum]WCQ95855.1 L-threonine 3-dehydrogenase [Sorangium sp. Soce836]
MSDTMWALTYNREKQPWESTVGLSKDEVERPAINEAKDYHDRASVLVKPIMTGFCGSDRGIWFRGAFKDMIFKSLDRDRKATRTIGHELLGRVVDLGSDARRTFGLEVGDIVSTESHIACGACYQCRVGDTHVCADDKIIGISEDGCFAELVKLPAKNLWRTDIARIRPEVAAVQEPFGNAVHACTKVNLRGKRVAIFGCGTIGLFAVAIARAMGAIYIIGVEPLERNAEMARRLGADVVLRPHRASPERPHASDPELTERVRKLTDGVGVDVVLEMSGVNSSVNNAIHAARRGGDVILFGLKSGDAVIENFDRLIVDGISLHSVIGRRMFETWHITRHLLESRDPNIHDLIWEVILNRGQETVFDFNDYDPAAFQEAISNHPKVILRY